MSKLYCGIKDTPKGSKKGSMLECAKAGKISSFGVNKIDDRLLKQMLNPGKKPPTREAVFIKLSKLRVKLKKAQTELRHLEDDNKKKSTAATKKKLASKKAAFNKNVDVFNDLNKQFNAFDESKLAPKKASPKKAAPKKAAPKKAAPKATNINKMIAADRKFENRGITTDINKMIQADQKKEISKMIKKSNVQLAKDITAQVKHDKKLKNVKLITKVKKPAAKKPCAAKKSCAAKKPCAKNDIDKQFDEEAKELIKKTLGNNWDKDIEKSLLSGETEYLIEQAKEEGDDMLELQIEEADQALGDLYDKLSRRKAKPCKGEGNEKAAEEWKGHLNDYIKHFYFEGVTDKHKQLLREEKYDEVLKSITNPVLKNNMKQNFEALKNKKKNVYHHHSPEGQAELKKKKAADDAYFAAKKVGGITDSKILKDFNDMVMKKGKEVLSYVTDKEDKEEYLGYFLEDFYKVHFMAPKVWKGKTKYTGTMAQLLKIIKDQKLDIITYHEKQKKEIEKEKKKKKS